MGFKYDKEKHMVLTLTGFGKTELRKIALKDKRNLNNFINVAIERYVEELQKNGRK